MGIISRLKNKKKVKAMQEQELAEMRARLDANIEANPIIQKTSIDQTIEYLDEQRRQAYIAQEEEYAEMREELTPEADHWVQVFEQKEEELTRAAEAERERELAAYSRQVEAEARKEVESNKYQHVFETRKAQFEERNPELHREDFASEEEYKAALIEQYKSVRRDEYEAICYERGVNFYNDSKDVIIAKKDFDVMDDFMWQTENRMRQQALRQNITLSNDSTAFHSFNVSERLINKETGLNTGHFESCAVSSSALVHDVCERFGMSAKENPIKHETDDHNIGILGADGKSYGSHCPCPNGQGDFGALLESGKIGPGDRISFKTKKKANNTTTGYHQRTVIAVEKDENGKVVGYTLQANNPCELSYHKISEAKGTTVKYSSTSRYVDQQIEREAAGMQNMSVEQIEQQLAAAKGRTIDVYENTSLNVEKRFLENPLSSKHAGYKREDRRAEQCGREAVFTAHYNKTFIEQAVQTEVAARTEEYAATLPPINEGVQDELRTFRADSEEFRNFERQAMRCGLEHPVFEYDIPAESYVAQETPVSETTLTAENETTESPVDDIIATLKKDNENAALATDFVTQLLFQGETNGNNGPQTETQDLAGNLLAAVIRGKSGNDRA